MRRIQTGITYFSVQNNIDRTADNPQILLLAFNIKRGTLRSIGC